MKITREFILDPSLALYIPLWKRDGATFMSDDQYGHLCTANGAPWGIQGRLLDGIDDVITVPNATSLQFDHKLTLIAWIKPTSFPAIASIIFSKQNHTDYALSINNAGSAIMQLNAADRATTAAGLIVANNWYFIVGTYDDSLASANVTISVNLAGTVTADYTTAINASINDLLLGNNATNDRDFAGIYGEGIAFNRVLSVGEQAYIREATKWRY